MWARREFTRAQKVVMLKHAMDGQGRIHCQGCGLNISGKAIEFDHVIPEALILDKTRELSADDGRVLGRDCCHRAPGAKTAQDLAVIAEAKRREARHLGIKPLPSRGFRRPAPQLRASRPLAKPAAWRSEQD